MKKEFVELEIAREKLYEIVLNALPEELSDISKLILLQGVIYELRKKVLDGKEIIIIGSTLPKPCPYCGLENGHYDGCFATSFEKEDK